MQVNSQATHDGDLCKGVTRSRVILLKYKNIMSHLLWFGSDDLCHCWNYVFFRKSRIKFIMHALIIRLKNTNSFT